MSFLPEEKSEKRNLASDEESSLQDRSVTDKDVQISVSEDSNSTIQIKEKKLGWKQTALLLLTEYVVLAILAFPSSYAVLGMAGGILGTLGIGLATLYTSHVLWRFCLAHPEIRDICDASYVMFGRHKFAWYAAFIGLAANNYAIMGLHSVASSVAIQTIRGGGDCTLYWALGTTAIMLGASFTRELQGVSKIGAVGALIMFVCFLVVMVGHAVQGVPNNYDPASPVQITTWAPAGTTFVQGVNALLNITYTWIGHALIPSFVGDMEHPEDFPKALYLSMAAEFLLFTLCGAYVYSFTGTQYTVAPAYGSLHERYGKVAAGLTLPTILIVGILYSVVTSRAILFKVFPVNSRHRSHHTVVGWSTWIGIVVGGWIISFIIGEAVPFFNDLLSLIASIFDSWFGFIFWAVAWYRLNTGRTLDGPLQISQSVMNILMLLTGFFFFFAGAYTSIQSIINSYATGAVKAPFTCVNIGFIFDR